MAKKSIVFRIEDEKGCGVYRGETNLYNYRKYGDFTRDRVHPVPKCDSKLMQSIPKCGKRLDCFGVEEPKFKWIFNFVFGFSSIEQLRAWFYEDEVIEWLHENGFSLVVYEGIAYHGNCQSIVRQGSKQIQKLSLTTLLEKSTEKQ